MFNIFAIVVEIPQMTTYESLVSSNELSLIQNKALIEALKKYEGGLNNLRITAEWENEQWNAINAPFINKKIGYLDVNPKNK